MSTPRPLPAVIGPTENVLRRLLTNTLATTRIGGYEQWVVVNTASTAGSSWQDTAAIALAIGLDDVARIATGLRAAGLMGAEGALTGAGSTQLAAARSAVAASTRRLMAGVSADEEETTRSVLDRVRRNAEALLTSGENISLDESGSQGSPRA